MIAIRIEFRVAPENVARTIEISKKLTDASRTEAGCRFYAVYRSREDPTVFFIHEEWDDQTALELHRTMPHYIEGAKNGIVPLMIEREGGLVDPI